MSGEKELMKMKIRNMRNTVLLLLCVVLFAGCAAQNQVKFTEGKYVSTLEDKRDIVYLLEFNFTDQENVSIDNALSSYLFRDSKYKVSGNELEINGTGLPSGETDTYTLVFTRKGETIVFDESQSTNYKAFNLRDGNTFERNENSNIGNLSN